MPRRIIMMKGGNTVYVQKPVKQIFESMGYKEITKEELQEKDELKRKADQETYDRLKESQKMKQEEELAAITDEWDAIDDEGYDEPSSIVEYVKSTPISELTPAKIREFGEAVGDEPLANVKRSDQGRKLLEKYLDEHA